MKEPNEERTVGQKVVFAVMAVLGGASALYIVWEIADVLFEVLH